MQRSLSLSLSLSALTFSILTLSLAACSGPSSDDLATPSSPSAPAAAPAAGTVIALPRGDVAAPAQAKPVTGVVRAAAGSPAAVLEGDDLDAFDAMATAVAAQQRELAAKKQACIGKGVALDSSLQGHVDIAVRLEADGSVRGTEVTSNADLPPVVVACIRKAVTETHYLPPKNAAAFTRRESAGIP